ncbi:MAG: class B sortase [Beduini sp.]|uniref:class B sortase n=1 Tax=Beduini sp. TaxID=1922300 RepID=UPI0039A00EBE
MKKYIRRILLVVCVIVFCFSAYQLFTIFMQYKTVDDNNAQIRNTVIPEKKEDVPFTIDFAKLKEINSDAVAWLNIEDTDISYAVVQAGDNDYYLHRNLQKEDSFAGTLFADYQNSSDFSDFNTIIYGHNMKNGSMFGKLKKYKDVNYYNEHPYIDLYIEGQKLRYQVFSARDVDVASTKTYYNVYGQSGLKQEMIDEWFSTALYSTEVEVTPEDQVITLSTCVDSLDDQYRFVVNAKLIETSDY